MIYIVLALTASIFLCVVSYIVSVEATYQRRTKRVI